MPNIENFDYGQDPEKGIDVQATGAGAMEEAGYHIGRLYHQAGDELGAAITRAGEEYVKNQTNAQLLTADKLMAAQKHANTDVWNQALADDAAAGTSAATHGVLFQQTMGDRLQSQYEQGFAGLTTREAKEAYNKAWGSYYSDFQAQGDKEMHTNALIQSSQDAYQGNQIDIARAAQNGVASLSEIEASITNRAALTIRAVGADPAGTQTILKMRDKAIELAYSTAGRTTLEGAATRAAQANPADPAAVRAATQAVADQLMSDPKFAQRVGAYVNPITGKSWAMDASEQAADDALRNNASTNAAQREAAEAQATTAMFQVRNRSTAPDGTWNPTPQDRRDLQAIVAQYGSVSPEISKSALAMLGEMDTHAREVISGDYVQDNPATVAQLKALAGTSRFEDAIAQARSEKLLSKDTATAMHEQAAAIEASPDMKALYSDVVPSAIKGAEPAFGTSVAGPFGATSKMSPSQSSRYEQWKGIVYDKVEQLRHLAVSPQDIQKRLFTLGSPESVVSPAFINRFANVPVADTPHPQVKPAEPESAAARLDRLRAIAGLK